MQHPSETHVKGDGAMPNINGSMYGLTVLSPINMDPNRNPSNAVSIREFLAGLEKNEHSPFAKVATTHLARWVVINDVIFEGAPAHQDHLKSQYLLFTSNFDGDLKAYLNLLWEKIPDVVKELWGHCVGFPGTNDAEAFRRYIEKCQIKTSFFFADVNDASLEKTLRALFGQKEFVTFVEDNQGKPGDQIHAAFKTLMEKIRNAPDPNPGAF